MALAASKQISGSGESQLKAQLVQITVGLLCNGDVHLCSSILIFGTFPVIIQRLQEETLSLRRKLLERENDLNEWKRRYR